MFDPDGLLPSEKTTLFGEAYLCNIFVEWYHIHLEVCVVFGYGMLYSKYLLFIQMSPKLKEIYLIVHYSDGYLPAIIEEIVHLIAYHHLLHIENYP